MIPSSCSHLCISLPQIRFTALYVSCVVSRVISLAFSFLVLSLVVPVLDPFFTFLLPLCCLSLFLFIFPFLVILSVFRTLPSLLRLSLPLFIALPLHFSLSLSLSLSSVSCFCFRSRSLLSSLLSVSLAFYCRYLSRSRHPSYIPQSRSHLRRSGAGWSSKLANAAMFPAAAAPKG